MSTKIFECLRKNIYIDYRDSQDIEQQTSSVDYIMVMDENEVDEARKKAKDVADLIEIILGDDSILQKVKDAAEDAVESVKNMVSHEPTIAEKVKKAAQDAGEVIADTANSAVETVKEMVYPEPTITEQVKEVAHDTGEAVVDTANTAIDSVKEMVTPEPTFMEKVHNAYHDAEETVEGWWRRVYEWWNPPWFTDDDGLTFIGVIFYLLLAASFVALCWFAYRWYRTRQTMNNAVQNLENLDEDSNDNDNQNVPDSTPTFKSDNSPDYC